MCVVDLEYLLQKLDEDNVLIGQLRAVPLIKADRAGVRVIVLETRTHDK